MMKNRLLGAGLLLLCGLLLLAACGQSSQARMDQIQVGQIASPTPQASISSTRMGQMQMGQMTASPVQGSASTTPASTIPAHTATEQPVAVHITLTDFRITASRHAFQEGMPYRFTVSNQGNMAHELLLMSTMMKSMNMHGVPMHNLDQMALAMVEDINPGATKTLDYTFELATTGPHPELSCRLPGHYEAGMHLDLMVSH